VPSAVSRGPISTRIYTELLTEGFPVGDNGSPSEPYGWSGEANSQDAEFTPWMTFAALTGRPQRPGGSFDDTQMDWVLPYTVYYAGVSRRQCEALADRMRASLVNIAREDVTGENGTWRIQQITCTTIGGSTKIGSAYPDYYTQSDTFDVWVTKRRG
jgi:hypothetical protein